MSDEKLEVKETDMEEQEQHTVLEVVKEAQRLYNIDKVGFLEVLNKNYQVMINKSLVFVNLFFIRVKCQIQ